MNRTFRINSTILLVAQLVLFLILTVFLFDFRSYPYADDWTIISPLGMEHSQFIDWLFAQHVDHRIPLQKALQFFTAKAAGFDFRVLVFVNVTIALFASLTLTAAARNYRGYAHPGDLCIPLIVLLPSEAFSMWAFELQFLSSVFFAATALYFAGQYSKDGKKRYLALMLVQLALCALCGMNGSIFSSVLLFAIALHFALEFKAKRTPPAGLTLLLAAVAIENIVIWTAWTPSNASDAATNVPVMLEMALKLLPASVGLFAVAWINVKVIAVIALLLGAAFYLFKKTRHTQLSLVDITFAFVVLAGLAEILSVAIGRSKAQGGWSDGLAMHYAILTALIPIAAWIVISASKKLLVTVPLGLGLVAICLAAYSQNFAWRTEYRSMVVAKQRNVERAFKTDIDAHSVVDRFPLELVWGDSPEAKSQATAGLDLLRKHNVERYAAGVPFTVTPLASGALPDTAEANLAEATQLTKNDGWADAGDFQRTQSKSMVVFGTYRVSDADLGAVALTLRRGQRVYYRSGPHTESQSLTFTINGSSYRYPLPVSGGWSVIQLSAESLPEQVAATFRDDGATWGEWSAIALAKSAAPH